MDIATQVEIVLRDSGYETWSWTGTSPAVICFEDASLVGFVHVFVSADALLTQWQAEQEIVLARHMAALRSAGVKAWNVYSIFLTGERSRSRQRLIERIEEDFTLTRKIARSGMRTPEDVEQVLLPLGAVRAQPLLRDAKFESRVRSRVKDISPTAIDAFLSKVNADEVARILGEEQ